jgi:hypothetical protein
MEFDWSCQGASLPFRTSSLIIRRVIIRLIRFGLLCGLNVSGDSGRTFDNICSSGRECTEKEHNAHEFQNILRFDIYFNCFECDNIGTFKEGITLFFRFYYNFNCSERDNIGTFKEGITLSFVFIIILIVLNVTTLERLKRQ